jgi:Tfp pilus assembly protein PilO
VSTTTDQQRPASTLPADDSGVGTARAPRRRRPGGGAGSGSRRRRRFDLHRDGRRLALAFAVLLAVNLLFWYFGVRPVRAEIAALEASKATAEMSETQSAERLAWLRDVRDRTVDRQEKIRRFYDRISTKDQRSVKFQRALAAVGDDFRVRPDNMAMNFGDLEQEGIEVMSATFPLSGGYENLRQFLARLESLDQFLIVREIALQGGREGGTRLRLNVALETYFNAPDMREEKARQRAWEERMRNRRRSTRR